SSMRRLPALHIRALVGFVLTTAAAATTAAQSSPHEQLARSIYKELIEINTVDSVGSVTKAAQAMAARFTAAGFPASDVQILIPPGKPNKGNLVVRYHGRGGPNAPKPILLLAHLDVVAALRSDWPRDPFTLTEENGFFLGRGTADDKAMASIFVANLLEMKAQGIVPDRDIILALTADEEGGDANGVRWLTREHKDLIDAEYALNEGGGGELANGKPTANDVQAAEKVSVNFTLTAVNPGGHSSMPRPDNAIYELSSALLKIASFRFPVVLNDVTKVYFARAATVEPRTEIAAAMKAIVAHPNDAKASATLSKDPRLASILRTTCVATRLAGGHAYNALPQMATANVNCRAEPTSTYEYVKSTLERVVQDTGVKIAFLDGPHTGPLGAPPSAVNPELLTAVTAITKKMWGDIPVIPFMVTAATDGRYLRAVGIPTFGVNGIFAEGEENNMHGRDEKLRVKSYYEGLAFLDQLVRALAVKTKS
ncbi:MAG TPA: M20/M25/M40 family metallo-hydrolase, partial [Gemmatimonadaceae bacterium]|nr:M20/M25/M40 family metallo-hydrolase [Gemmatimonadaceae bacterium]